MLRTPFFLFLGGLFLLLPLTALGASDDDDSSGSDESESSEPDESEPKSDEGGNDPPAGSEDATEALRQELEILKLQLDALAEAVPEPAPGPAVAPNVFNPRITGFIDLMGSVGIADHGVSPAFDVRAFELDLRADIDPFAKAVVVLGFENPLAHAIEHAAHEGEHEDEHEDEDEDEDEDDHGAEEVAEAWLSIVEEANISFVALPAHLFLELGLVRVDFGGLNRLHLHDLPHPDLPGTSSSLFGEHGWADAGAFLRYRLHNPRSLPIDFKVGIMSRGPERLMEGRETPTPIVLGRFQASGDPAPGSLLSGGLSYAYWKDATEEERGFHLGAVDFLAKIRAPGRGQSRSFFVNGELQLAHRLQEGGRTSLGGFVDLGFQPTRNVFFAFRGEARTDHLDVEPIVWGAGVSASLYTSEFLRMRLAYDLTGEEELTHRLGLQITAVFGSHPVEPYWVNR